MVTAVIAADIHVSLPAAVVSSAIIGVIACAMPGILAIVYTGAICNAV